MSVQTACSTSLVAVHLACQSLLNCECDMALAGGVTIEIPHARGYVYREGEILSRDGHCRAFDAASSGTVFSSGVGIVVLRRLEDAIADHDTIHAVILGSAVNNDGQRKVGYLAPSVAGQAEVIAEALGVAGADADSITYVETHGTGTVVGDPIEIKGLTQAFREATNRNGYLRHRIAEDERWTSRYSGRRRRTHQDGTGTPASTIARQPPLPQRRIRRLIFKILRSTSTFRSPTGSRTAARDARESRLWGSAAPMHTSFSKRRRNRFDRKRIGRSS